MCTKLKNSQINGYLEINGFVNNNVCTYENLYIRKIKIRNILEMKYSQFTVFNTNRMAIFNLLTMKKHLQSHNSECNVEHVQQAT